MHCTLCGRAVLAGEGLGLGPTGTPLGLPAGLEERATERQSVTDTKKLENVKMVQVNLNKSNSAMQELTISLRKERDFLCMITEPSVIKNKLSGIPKHYSCIPMQRGNSPRAAILASNTIAIQEIRSICHRDIAVGLIKCKGKQTAVISAYMDIKEAPITQQLQVAIDYCKSKGYSILLTVDSNSHSKLWGNETNTRGKKWEEFIEKEHMIVHNLGRIPTFESKNGKSIIDITLSYRIPNNIDNWRVLRRYNGTDHSSIHYTMTELRIDLPEHRLYHKANWDQFSKLLEESYINIPSELTESRLDKIVDRLNLVLNRALDKSCPMAKAKSIDPNNSWWSPQLKDKRNQVIKGYDKYKNDRKNKDVEQMYKKHQKEYKKLLRKAKKQHEHIENCLLYTSPSPRDRQKSRMPSSA